MFYPFPIVFFNRRMDEIDDFLSIVFSIFYTYCRITKDDNRNILIQM